MESRTLCPDQALLACKGLHEVTKMFISGPSSDTLRSAAMLLASPGPPPSLPSTSSCDLSGVGSGAVRPTAPALGSGHFFSHQTRRRAGKQGDSRYPKSGKTRSQSSQMVTSAPGQNKAHTEALAGSVPGVSPPLELAGTQGKERAQPKPMVSRPRHLQGGR